MSIAASRFTLNFLAIGLIAVAVGWQALAGFRISEGAGSLAEMIAMLLYAVAIILFLAPLGRRHAALVALVAFAAMYLALYLNIRWTTEMDIRYGGEYAWSGMRAMVVTYFVGPILAVIVGIATGLLAWFGGIRWTSEAGS